MITNRALQILDYDLKIAQASVDRYNELLARGSCTREYMIDEIALLVEGEGELRQLQTGLTALGWVKFNEVRDRVSTSPILSKYEVQYTFFNHVDKPWRLEVMKMMSGYSPLHGALPKPKGSQSCVPVHASFKVAAEEFYAYAREDLDGMEMFEAQRCDSAYGRFSYWTRFDQSDAVPYLKPRVNLRDSTL